MILKEDIINQVWIWVDDEDESYHLSPHFDYEEDALEWKRRLLNKIVETQERK